MKKSSRVLWPVLLILFIAVLLSGCGGKRTPSPTATTFQLNKDGTVTHTIKEAYTDSFTEEELENYVREQITAYVVSEEEPAVTLEECSIAKEEITIVMNYASIDEYAAFNQVSAYLGDLSSAARAGYSFARGFVTDTGLSVSGFTLPAEYPDLSVLILQESQNVIVPFEPILISDDITVNEDGSYSIAKEKGYDLPEILETVNPGCSYLIYRTAA